MTDSIQQRVARGAQWLDEVRPGWRDSVKPSALEMADTCKCICGQVFAEVAGAHGDGYGYVIDNYSDADNWDVDHGFCADEDNNGVQRRAEWEALEVEWLRVILGPVPHPATQREAVQA